MTALLEKKRQSCKSLLTISEEMMRMVESGDYDSISGLSARRDRLIKDILAIDEEMRGLSPLLPTSNKQQATELISLIKRIDYINNWLTEKVSERTAAVGNELGKTRKVARVISRYAEASAL